MRTDGRAVIQFRYFFPSEEVIAIAYRAKALSPSLIPGAIPFGRNLIVSNPTFGGSSVFFKIANSPAGMSLGPASFWTSQNSISRAYVVPGIL